MLPPDVERRLQEALPKAQRSLRRLIEIPSVSAPGFDPAAMVRSSDLTAELFREAGMDDVSILTPRDSHPAVIARRTAPAGSPTILLYAHHDVQPAGPPERWTTPPFEASERDGRLYGRGAADDKAGIAIHLAALEAWSMDLPVGVVVLIEGAEETASGNSMEELLAHPWVCECDAAVFADGANLEDDKPSIATSMRGLVDFTITVETLPGDLHSGLYGGPTADALAVLVQLLASLNDRDGSVAVDGLHTDSVDEEVIDEDELRALTGLSPHLRLLGEGGVTERLWGAPAVTVVGIDAPTVADASNRLVARARSRVSVRVAPSQTAESALAAIREHLARNAPWGAPVSVSDISASSGWARTNDGPANRAMRRALAHAYDSPVDEVGEGGTLPVLASVESAMPGAELLAIGISDPHTNLHAPNESMNLRDLERNAWALTAFLGLVATPARVEVEEGPGE